MRPIREFVSELIGQVILPNQWDKTFAELLKEGRPDARDYNTIIMELCKRMEILENQIKEFTVSKSTKV